VWSWARGMPDLDIAGLGRAAAREQDVTPYDATEE